MTMLFNQENLPVICRNFTNVIENNPYLKHRFEQVQEYGRKLFTLNVPVDTILKKIKRLIDRIHDIIGFDLDRELRKHCYRHKDYMPDAFTHIQGGFYVWTNILIRFLLLGAMPEVFEMIKQRPNVCYELTDGITCYDMVFTV